MTEEDDKLLRDAIARNKCAVLSLPIDGTLRHCKSRFLAEHEGGILLEAAAGHEELVQSLMAANQDCFVCFKKGFDKLAFVTKIARMEPQWPLSETAKVDALLVSYPADIKTLQRRSSYRARVPADYSLRVRLWTVADWAYINDVPPRNQEVTLELRDLSVGGIGVRLPGKDGQSPRISINDRLRIQLTFGVESVILEGRMRQPAVDPRDASRLITGISFKKLEANIEGRQALSLLTQIVGDLQREELRQNRFSQDQPQAA
jgi:c-di-GMP-binding flagellar brake protein YcgR